MIYNGWYAIQPNPTLCRCFVLFKDEVVDWSKTPNETNDNSSITFNHWRAVLFTDYINISMIKT